MAPTIQSPRVSARALIIEEDALLVSCYRDDRGPWYVTPGGGQRRGETLHQCLVREVREEANAEIRIGRLRWVREFISARYPDSTLDPSFHQIEMIFECSLADAAALRLGDSPDPGQTGLRWLALSDLANVRFYSQEAARILLGEIDDRPYLGDVG